MSKINKISDEIKNMLVEAKETGTAEIKSEVKADAIVETKADEAMNTGNTGAAYNQEDFSNALLAEYDKYDKISGLGQTVAMPTQVYNLPYATEDPKFYRNGENTDVPGNDPKSSKAGYGSIKLIADKVTCITYLSRELVEGERFDVRKDVFGRIVKALDTSATELLVNGDIITDDTNINSVGVVPSAYESYLIADGIRKQVIAAGNFIDGGVIDYKKLVKAKAKLRDKGINISDLVMLVDVDTYSLLLDMDEFKTMDQFGNEAANKTGIVGRILGISVKVIAELKLSDADGKIDAATPANNTKGTILFVNEKGVYKGLYGDLVLKTTYDDVKDQYRIVCHANLAVTVKQEFVSGVKNIDLS